MIVPPNKASGLMLCVRCLPAKAVVLNENSRFTGHDVGGMTIETFVVSTTKMPDHCMDIKDFFPCGPVVFSEEPLSHADYRKTVLTDFPNLMIFCRVLANLTLNQCRDYIRDPKFPTGNKHRFDPSHKHSSNLPDDSTFNKSTGTHMFSKYGPNFNVWYYAPSIQHSAKKYICLSWTDSTWKSYRTAWDSLFSFLKHIGSPLVLPLTFDVIVKYVNYLILWRKVKVVTAKSYLSAVKTLHKLNKCEFGQFEDYHLYLFLKGLDNWEATLNLPTLNRNVMTFSVLKLLGQSLSKSEYCKFDINVIWTACLICFWSSTRFGELISTNENSLDLIRAVTWDKLNFSSEQNYTLFVPIPKTSEEKEGFIVDILSYSDSRYCPINYINILFNQCEALNKARANDLLFVLADGTLLNMRFMNILLEKCLRPYFSDPNVKFSCHSFRSGLPSLMSANPHLFSEEDIMTSCRWKSNSCKRYTRLRGFKQRNIMGRVHKLLQK